ncbi:helix-turn-helix domain-containing protein [Williamsia serinedens]|uniref:helix-turn-helix domain-containing protein n=1 Tax=Williamsia serinedens TaxID=391736 RepID=UPI0020A53F4C|nr:helix-turn-helix domain-containing protein [Williamsia serinedens]
MSAAALSPTRFEVSTSDDHAVLAWERHNAAALMELSCEVPGDGRFVARESNLVGESLRLAHVRGSAHRVQRSASMIDDRPVDAVAVYVARRGAARIHADGVDGVLQPGQLLVCDPDRPLRRVFEHGLDEFAVVIPRDDWAQVSDSTRVTPTVVDVADDVRARSLVRLTTAAFASTATTTEDLARIVATASVLAGAATLGVERRVTAHAFIDDNLGDPGLTAASVAAATGVSERQLSRLFAADGTTVPRHVLARRLDRAYAVLTAPGASATAAEVALRCGFSSIPWFSTSFRRRFDITPAEARRSGRRPA